MKSFLLFIAICIFFTSCSSVEYAQVNASLKGKKVGIIPFDFQGTKKRKSLSAKDTICYCVGQSASTAITPYLMKAGFEVIPFGYNEKLPEAEVWRIADSLGLDYVVTAKGIVSVVGSSNFIEVLNLHMNNVISKKTHLAVNFSGVSIRVNRAAKKIGNTIFKKLK